MAYPNSIDNCINISPLTDASCSGSINCDLSDITNKLIELDNKINNISSTVCGCVNQVTIDIGRTLNQVDSGIRQIIREVTEGVTENHTIVEKTGFIVTI